MNRFGTPFALLALLSVTGSGNAQDIDALINDTIAGHAMPMDVATDGIRGPGADILVESGTGRCSLA